MKILLIIIVLIHGLIHLLGFVKGWNLVEEGQVSGATLFPISSKNTAHTLGLLWFAAFLIYLTTAIGIAFNKETWWKLGLAAVLLSQVLIIIYWKDAKWGTIANLVILIAAIISYANWNFNAKFERDVNQMFAQSPTYNNTLITEAMLSGLPVPVRKWLHNSGIVGKEKIYNVRLKQKGFMRLNQNQDKWIETTAEQYFTIDKPAFFWKVKMNMMSMVPVSGKDKFIDGQGQMQIKLFSLVNFINQDDEKIAIGALQRWLAEIAWFPSAALSPYILWKPIDETSAKAIITYKAVSATVIFYFNETGDLKACIADRYKGGGKDAVLEKWMVESKGFAIRKGIRIPTTSEVTWKLRSGDFTWYKLQITDIDYNQSVLY